MSPRVLAAFAAHGGVLTREQTLDLGLPPSEVRRLVRSGEWVRLRRGVYTTAELWTSLDDRGRRRLLARAVIATMKRGWVLSHGSSADEHDLATLVPKEPYVHVTRPGFTNAWTENGVKHHLARFAHRQVVELNGVRTLDRARTAVDIAREDGLEAGVVACDSAMNQGSSRTELEVAYAPMESWPFVTVVRRAVELADGGAENPHESLGRLLVIEAGIGDPDTQFPVRTPEGIKWCDIRVGNHVIETDGRVKYRSVEEGGVALRPADEVAFEERKRERLVRDQGLGVTRLYWEDYWGARRAAAIRRLQADHADSCARFGPELSERLAREAEAIRRQYGDRRRRPQGPTPA